VRLAAGAEFVKIYWRVGVVAAIQFAIAFAARSLAVNLISTVALMAASAATFVLVYAMFGFAREGDRRLLSLLLGRFR